MSPGRPMISCSSEGSSPNCAGGRSPPRSCRWPRRVSAELAVVLGSPARGRPAHPAGAGFGHNRRSRAGHPARAHPTLDLRGTDRDRRGPARGPARERGSPAASLWAAVPHYVHQVPSPKAALALVERSAALLGAPVDPVDLRAAAVDYERQVSERVADDEDAAAYVAQLEDAEDTGWDDVDPSGPPRLQLGSIDELAAEVERFLRDHPRDRVVARPTPRLVAAAVWQARPEVIVALDDRFGEPVDAYVNGSQVWLREDGPGGMVLEWRLHPVAGYRRPSSHRHLRGLRRHRAGARNRGRAAGSARPSCGTAWRCSRPTGTRSSRSHWSAAATAALGHRTRRLRAGRPRVDRRPSGNERADRCRSSPTCSFSCGPEGPECRGCRERPPENPPGRGSLTSPHHERRSGAEPVVDVHLAEHPAEPGQAVDRFDRDEHPRRRRPLVVGPLVRQRTKPSHTGLETARINSKPRRLALTTRVSRSRGGDPRRSGGRVPRTGTSTAPNAFGSASTTMWAA